MFKRLLTILLLSAYTVATSGMVLQVHFCCGEIDGVSLQGTADNDGCPMGPGMKRMPGCCSDRHIELKIGDDRFAPVAVKAALDPAEFVAFAPLHDVVTEPNLNNRPQPNYYLGSPPGLPPPDLQAAYCVFRI
jgi:hypothetical protein